MVDTTDPCLPLFPPQLEEALFLTQMVLLYLPMSQLSLLLGLIIFLLMELPIETLMHMVMEPMVPMDTMESTSVKLMPAICMEELMDMEDMDMLVTMEDTLVDTTDLCLPLFPQLLEEALCLTQMVLLYLLMNLLLLLLVLIIFLLMGLPIEMLMAMDMELICGRSS